MAKINTFTYTFKMNTSIYYVLAFLIGIGLSVQIGLNTQLRTALGNPIAASLVSFLVGTLALVIYALVFQRELFSDFIPNIKGGIAWYKWAGGLFGALYIAGMILIAPQIGVANIVALSFAGQLLFALVLDHFGLLGFSMHALNQMRVLGACLLIAGTILILRN